MITPAQPYQLTLLADRCEQEKPSRALDAQIADAINPPVITGILGELLRDIVVLLCPPFTRSLDAALTINYKFGNGWLIVALSDIGADGLPFVKLATPSFIDKTNPSVIETREAVGIGGRTLALTFCAAALRALSMEYHNGRP